MAITHSYESVVIISTKLGDEGIEALVEKFKGIIERHATLGTVDHWGKRKLAYLINKESEGYYVLFNFESDADFPAELDRRYKITDGIIRSLIIRKDEAKAAEKEVAEEPVKEEVKEEAVEQAAEEIKTEE